MLNPLRWININMKRWFKMFSNDPYKPFWTSGWVIKLFFILKSFIAV